MPYAVWLTDGAARDLDDLTLHLERRDGPDQADLVLAQIDTALGTLAQFPMRGAYPPELLALGMKEYRELLCGPYRIIYRVASEAVYVLAIVDGRRDLQALLQRRLLEG
jgi:toxin ParE1/3/4